MKVIFYLADSLSPSIIFEPQKKIITSIKNNFISKIMSKSIYFSNCFGYGDTFASTTPMMTGRNPYAEYADAFFLINSFKANNNLSLFFKKQNFYNIYYSNIDYKAQIYNNEYERYFNLATQNYDVIQKKKRKLNYNFKNFFDDNNLKSINSKHKNIFYFFHEDGMHSDPNVYKNCDKQTYLKSFNKLSRIFENQLSLINYNKNTDIIYFLSDHGMLLKPYDQIYFNKKLSNENYNSYYKKILEDNKIKFLFFINNPNQKPALIKNYTVPENIFTYVKNNFLNLNKKNNLKTINNKYIIVSSKSSPKSPYHNVFDKLCFHNHFLYISKKKRIIFNKKHPELFVDMIKNIQITNKDKINKRLISAISNYYSFKNKSKKLFFFLITIFFKIKHNVTTRLHFRYKI
jgi:hypothetical protein